MENFEKFRTVETDVLVVGAGGAGGRAAIEADRNNASVVIVDKGIMGMFGVTATAGARAIGKGHPFDFKSCLKLGSYLSDQDLLEIAIKEAPEDHNEMAQWSITDTDSFTSAIRYEIMRHPGITLMEYVMITKLLTRDGRIVGATGLDIRSGDFILFKAKAVILATGGVGELYRPSECLPLDIRSGGCGDGQVMAYHAGVELVNMEMVQFQVLPESPKWMKWTRHVLMGTDLGFWTVAHAGPFYDEDGKACIPLEFMNALYGGKSAMQSGQIYHPELENRIYEEMRKGPVYINLAERVKDLPTFISQEKARTRKDMPTTVLADRELSKQYPFLSDPIKLLPRIRIVIGVLLGQGGPKVNVKCETSLPGFYGAGEGAGSGCLYGAFRPGASMDTILTFGRRAGKYAAEYAKTVRQGGVDLEEVGKERDRIYGFLKPKPDSTDAVEVKKKIRETTGKYLHKYRNEKGLKEAIKEIEELRRKDLPRIQAVDIKRLNYDWVEALEVPFMLDVAEMIARSALYRTESRGCQYREDYPEMDNENWLCHTLMKKENGGMKLSKASVKMTKFKPPPNMTQANYMQLEPVPV